MKAKLFVVLCSIITLSACSILSGGDGEKKIVDDEEITVRKVYISKERLQCEDNSGKTLDDTKDELELDSIKVFSSECGILTGLMAPALCGATTLHINIHGIDERKMPEAEALGFKSVSSFEDDLGFEIKSCKK